MDEFDPIASEFIFVYVYKKHLTCDTVPLIIALAILKSFSVLKHFEDDTLKW